MSPLPDYSDEFDTIEKYWHFEDLCKDLAEYKVRSLTANERQILQGVLLGYGPTEIANLRTREQNSGSENTPNNDGNAISNILSRDIAPWIEKLIYAKITQIVDTKRPRIPVWLERVGYRKNFMCPAKTVDSSPRLSEFDTEQLERDRPQPDIAPSTTPIPSSNSRV